MVTDSIQATRHVCVIQPVMKGYRIPFFLRLSDALARHDVTLSVVYGTPWAAESKRGDHAALPGAVGIPVQNVTVFGKLLIQPVLRPWLHADLVIVEQANKHALNYLLLILRAVGAKRLCYWGHGRDRQLDPGALSERFKRATLRAVDWWFAYTRGVAEYVAAAGFPPERITVVQNAVDTAALRSQVERVSEEDRAQLRSQLGFSVHDAISVFCGSLYANKRLDLLLQAAELIHANFPAFRLVVIGGGPLSDQIQSFAAGREWIRYVGPKFGGEKAGYLSMADTWLNPGLVGLGILDAFAAGLPLLTTEQTYHSPEIEYLRHGVNGLFLPGDAFRYAREVERLLRDKSQVSSLRRGARESAERYTLDQMVNNFSDGVLKCLHAS